MRYYGNKTKLLRFISSVAEPLFQSNDILFFDLFSGTTVVAQHFKSLGYEVITNDWLYFSQILAIANIRLNSTPKFINLKKKLDLALEKDIIEYINNIKPEYGFITKNYTPFENCNRQYFTIENGAKIDSIRSQIEVWRGVNLLDDDEYSYLIASLLYAVNKVSNVSGTYGSFLKTWDNRAFKSLELEHINIVSNGKTNRCFNKDAESIVDQVECDILYLDPPYNSRQYASNYFMLELIAEGWFNDNLPKIYGHTGMRPYDHQKSKFASKVTAQSSLKNIVDKAKAKYILLSYNNEGIIHPKSIHEILSSRGEVNILEYNHKRYRSVGQDGSNSRTVEYLYVLKVRNF